MFSSDIVSDEMPPLLDPETETEEEELELADESSVSSEEVRSWSKAEAISDSLSDKLSLSVAL